MSIFTQPIQRTLTIRIHPRHKKRIKETYTFQPFPGRNTPWLHVGGLTNGNRVVGHVRCPRHLTTSEEYHAFWSWVVNDLVTVHGTGVSIERIR